jgi:tetratricopeptide (TPR) repeat protein
LAGGFFAGAPAAFRERAFIAFRKAWLDDSNEHLLGNRVTGIAASIHTGSAHSMSEQGQDSASGAGSAADVRRIISLFATDRAAAFALIRGFLQSQQPAGMVLQHLNRFGRPDIVAAFADGLSHDAKTPDLIVFEHARALAANGAQERGEKILEAMSAVRERDYAFQYSAGRLLSDLRRHTQALKYYDKAFRIKPTSQVVERVFASHIALEQYTEAAKAMGRLLRAGSYRPGLGKEFALLLERIAPGELDPEIAYALATVPGTESSIAAALMPHLVAADLLESVLARLQHSENAAALEEDSLLAVIPYLARRGQIEPLLRVYERYGASSSGVNACFTQVLNDLPSGQMAQFLSPQLTGFLDERKAQGEAKNYLEAAQRFRTSGGPDAALVMLQLLPRVIAPASAQTFYAREKTRLARLASFVTERLGRTDDVLNSLATFIASWMKPIVRDFFSGPEFADLMDIVAAAKTLRDAPEGSHAAHLREEYFEHYLERRSEQPHEIDGDFAFCEKALSYFSALSHQRPVATFPVGASLTSRLGRPVLSMGNGRLIDALAAFGLLQNRPQISLTQPKAYDDFCWWYLSALAGTGKVPPACLQPEVVAYLDEDAASGDLPGLRTSRFLKLVWSNSEVYRKQLDFGNAIDRMRFRHRDGHLGASAQHAIPSFLQLPLRRRSAQRSSATRDRVIDG